MAIMATHYNGYSTVAKILQKIERKSTTAHQIMGNRKMLHILQFYLIFLSLYRSVLFVYSYNASIHFPLPSINLAVKYEMRFMVNATFCI